MRGVLCVLLLVAMAFAGCASDNAKPDQVTLGDGSTVTFDTQTFSAGHGAISGVVVDEAIRPIVGANVTLMPGAATTRTDQTGKFTFNDLLPGFYTISVVAAGFQRIQSSADVVAGEAAKVRIVAPADYSPVPYHTTVSFRGFIEAWAGIGQYFLEAAAPNGTGLCECYLSFTPDTNLTGLVFEAIWTPTTPDPSGLADSEFYYNVGQDHSDMFEQGYCTSPCRAEILLTDYMPGTTIAYLQGPDTYLAYQQQYDMYVTTFYRGPVPSDYSFVNSDE